jgi:hypothetical protein
MYTQAWDTILEEVSKAVVIRDVDQAFIPLDANNTDCQVYLAWLAEGNTPTEHDAPSPPAQKGTSRKGR